VVSLANLYNTTLKALVLDGDEVPIEAFGPLDLVRSANYGTSAD
jgi:hypothetical protein